MTEKYGKITCPDCGAKDDDNHCWSCSESKEGIKHDQEKNRYDLLPAESLDQIASIFTFGASKYDDRNWENGIVWGRMFAALQRHLWAFWRGEDIDEESGLPHLAHAGCNIMMLIHYSKFNKDMDDRPSTKLADKVDNKLRNLNYKEKTCENCRYSIKNDQMRERYCNFFMRHRESINICSAFNEKQEEKSCTNCKHYSVSPDVLDIYYCEKYKESYDNNKVHLFCSNTFGCWEAK